MYNKPMHLDGKLYEEIIVHTNSVTTADVFGVEVELEGLNIRTEKQGIRKYWQIHADGSLRGGIPGRANGLGETAEYVSNEPFTYDTTVESLNVLFDYLNNPYVTVFPSYRTSIHIHINCAAETWRTIYNFITLCIIFDELFSSINGEHRIGNNFCLRFVDAEGTLNSLCNSMKRKGNIQEFPMNMRYGSINFASIRKFGTIEFRSMECTTDIKRVVEWLETLNHLKKSAREFNTPIDIINLFSQYSESEFGLRILGKYFLKYVDVPNFKSMLRRGMRLAQDFAFSSAWISGISNTKSVPRSFWEPPPPPPVEEEDIIDDDPEEFDDDYEAEDDDE